MKKDDFVTEVMFRKFTKGDIIALFPYDVDYHGNCTSYMHVGQHSGADFGGVLMCTHPAKENEYSDLKTELESLGYDLKVISRRNNRKYISAIREIRNNY